MTNNRIQRVIENMQKMELEQLLITAPASVFYLTGKWVHPGERMLALYLRTDGTYALYANKLFALDDTIGMPLIAYDDTDDCVQLLAASMRAGKIGIDKTWPSHFTIRLMEARNDLRPVIGSSCIDDARICKDEEELSLMRESSRKNDQTTLQLIHAIQPGMTEKEVGSLYESISESLGSSGPSFTPLICFGKNCAEPHHDTDKTVLKTGDSVILDVGLTWKSYCSDMTRTIFIGQPSDEQKRVYDVVCAANEAGRKAVRPGIPLKEIDRAARKVIEDAGYGPHFIHRTGHGIGLEVHEFPDVSAASEVLAKPGMVFSIEPGIYLPGKFGVRVEDLVAVTPDGCETLNQAPHDLIIR